LRLQETVQNGSPLAEILQVFLPLPRLGTRTSAHADHFTRRGKAMDSAAEGGTHVTSELIRVFPYRTSFTPTDPMAFIGYPPLIGRPDDRTIPVHVSVVFKWHRTEAEKMAATWADHYDDVKLGGPAYEDFGGIEFVPGRYLKHGCTITSRGCVKHCEWCPERNRPLFTLPITPGWIVQDSNLLACPDSHVRAVFEMLRAQGRAISFPGGLDKYFFKPWHRELLDSISIGELWFACDESSGLPQLEKVSAMLSEISIEKRRCYTMLGFGDESLEQSARRCERVYELGFLPFAQLYKPDDGVKSYPDEWRALQRKWSRPAAFRDRNLERRRGFLK
jgi:hypothetical protein